MSLPPIGFGCSPFRAGGARVDLEEAVIAAANAGYRLFDTAEMYGNEQAVGRALRRSGTRHAALIGKAWRTSYRPAALRRACEASLLRLGADAFDLYLLHAPGAWRHVAPLRDAEEIGWEELERRAVPRRPGGDVVTDDVPLDETWGAMERIQSDGLAVSIGVSNFARPDLERLSPLPAANQIAVAPLERDDETAGFCAEKGITVVAHSPLSGSDAVRHPAVLRVAAALSRTPAQVVLRWLVTRGFVPLPSSVDPARIRENLASLEIELDGESAAVLAGIAELRE